jgi:acyl carrier protein
MSDALIAGCAKIFREVSGLEDSSIHFNWSDEKLLNEPLEALDVDSLTLLEFVMQVESAYDVELDEEDVNRCQNVGDLVALVAAARNGSN